MNLQIRLSIDNYSGIYDTEYKRYEWFKNTLKHRDHDRPAALWSSGIFEWYQYGMRHRDHDSPAVIYPSGCYEWYQNGELHRDKDQPAAIWSYGTRHWYIMGERHRDYDLPAIVKNSGTTEWYKNGKITEIHQLLYGKTVTVLGTKMANYIGILYITMVNRNGINMVDVQPFTV
jgi:hypothetical protein